MNTLELAIAIAVKAHTGQFDKAGQPYILHPFRLMSNLRDQDEKIVAVMHDVVEDSDVTLEDLASQGFSETILSALDALTKRDGECYDDFIERVSKDALATRVKIEDLKDNMDLTRLPRVEDKDLLRVKKYHNALQLLTNLA